MSLVLFFFALGLILARLALLAGIFTGKLPRQTINAKSQTILMVDLVAAFAIGSALADVTHSAWASIFTWLFCLAYLATIGIRFPLIFKQEYKPMRVEVTIYVLAQAYLLLAYIVAL